MIWEIKYERSLLC